MDLQSVLLYAVFATVLILLAYKNRTLQSIMFATRQHGNLCRLFARRAGYVIVDEFYDASVKGADAVQERPGFAALLERIRGNGVRTIIVETANRFARDLIVQEARYGMLKAQGIEIIAADSPGDFVEDTPATLVCQVLGAGGEDSWGVAFAAHREAQPHGPRLDVLPGTQYRCPCASTDARGCGAALRSRR